MKIVRYMKEFSDLMSDEYFCTECRKIISREDVVKNDNGDSLSRNGINFCSQYCRTLNRNGYDKMVTGIFN